MSHRFLNVHYHHTLMDCDFDNDAMTCPRCGIEVMLLTKGRLTPEQARKVHKNCAKAPKLTTPCLHLGPELRRQECSTCQGKTEIKIFGCQVHGDCTIGKQIEALKCCAACPDYAPSPLLRA